MVIPDSQKASVLRNIHAENIVIACGVVRYAVDHGISLGVDLVHPTINIIIGISIAFVVLAQAGAGRTILTAGGDKHRQTCK